MYIIKSQVFSGYHLVVRSSDPYFTTLVRGSVNEFVFPTWVMLAGESTPGCACTLKNGEYTLTNNKFFEVKIPYAVVLNFSTEIANKVDGDSLVGKLVTMSPEEEAGDF